jgi:hypothetical protein
MDKSLAEKPELEINDKIYAVDCRTSTVLKMQKFQSKSASDIGALYGILGLLLGEKARKEIEALDLPFPALIQVLSLATAAATGEEPDEVNARFQKAKQSKG